MGKLTLGELLDILYEHHDDENAPIDTEVVIQCDNRALRFQTSEYDEEEEVVTLFFSSSDSSMSVP